MSDKNEWIQVMFYEWVVQNRKEKWKNYVFVAFYLYLIMFIYILFEEGQDEAA